MYNNTSDNPDNITHDQTILTSPYGIDISVDSSLAELITLLWANGVATLFSCEGTSIDFKWADEYSEDPKRAGWNEACHERAYITMLNSPESLELTLNLIRLYSDLGQSSASIWSFEFDHHHDQGARLVIRFPHNDIPKFVSFLRD